MTKNKPKCFQVAAICEVVSRKSVTEKMRVKPIYTGTDL